jgi:hypothetical protein
MTKLVLAAIFAASVALAQAPENVNSRYTVEAVELAPQRFMDRLSAPVKERFKELAGAAFDQSKFDDLTRKIGDEMRDRSVSMNIEKGSTPETIRIVITIGESRNRSLSADTGKLLYHSKENLSFGVNLRLGHHSHTALVGFLTDNDLLAERFSGIRAGYTRSRLNENHLAFGFIVESFRSQWNPAVQTALLSSSDIPGIYRERLHFEPKATVTIVEPLTLQLGVSLQRLQMQYPTARYELSSAAVGTLRFRQRWELKSRGRHELDASYNVRSATQTLDSDFIYTRHQVQARYAIGNKKEEIAASFQAGSITGRAPIFERFILGNSKTLRGWNKFDLDPLGGDRMAHASLDYHYSNFRAVYDTGSVWRRNRNATIRHSVAFGILSGGPNSFTAMVAFPIRDGSIEPIFMAGINF